MVREARADFPPFQYFGTATKRGLINVAEQKSPFNKPIPNLQMVGP